MKVICWEQGRRRLLARALERARSAFVHRDFGGALVHCWRAAKLDPDCARAQLLWGDALCALGRHPDALGCYLRARRLAPGRAEPCWCVSTVHSLTRRWRLSLRYLDEAQANLRRGDGPLFEWIPEDRAVALVSLDRGREALEAVRWGLRRRPQSARLRALQADLRTGHLLAFSTGTVQSEAPTGVPPCESERAASHSEEDVDDDRDP